MKELDKTLDISHTGPQAQQALDAFRRQIDSWGLVMPPVEPLVLDFGLGDFDRIGLIECWVANETEFGYCGKFLFVFDGQTCPMHRHREKHETFFIVKGRVKMTYDCLEREMCPGDVLPVDRWKYHSFTGVGPALLLECSMPCIVDDNYFEDSSIPIGGNYRDGAHKPQ